MNSNIAIPLQLRPRYVEGSGLASSRDSRNNSLAWKQAVKTANQNNSNTIAIQKIARELGKQRRRIVGGGSIPSVAIQDFKIVSDGGDYYNCHTFDGLTAGATIIKVAKNQDLRCILPTATPAGGAWANKVIRAVTYTYTYTPTAGTTTDGVNVIEYVRGVTGDDLSSETDNVTPCLNVGDIITGFQTSFAAPATLVGVTWQAQSDSRAWANQPPPP